jgi:hypothetical protein
MSENKNINIIAALILGGFILLAVCLGGFCLLSNTLLKTLLSEIPAAAEPLDHEDPCMVIEQIELLFSEGVEGQTTNNSFSGEVEITVSGVGQSAGSAFSDAFYLFTDGDGYNIPPEHPEEWILTINSELAHLLIPGQEIPAYSDDHIYTFDINIPEGPLLFGIQDGYTGDNTGSFWITICQH